MENRNIILASKQASKRVDEIDIIKGIAIILMVAGHADSPFTHFIYLFHMAVFFIASGFNFKLQYDKKGVQYYIRRRVEGLYLPYVLWNIFYTVLNNILIDLNVYTNNPQISKYVPSDFVYITTPLTLRQAAISVIKIIFFRGGTQLGGAFWFLRVLFIITIAYAIIDCIIEKQNVNGENKLILYQTLVSITFLLVGYTMHLHDWTFYGVESAASLYCLFHLGRLMKILRGRIKSKFYLKQSFYFFGLILSYFVLILLNSRGSVNLNSNNYKSPFFLLLSSISGWYFMWMLAYYLQKWEMVKRILIMVGKRTMAIVEMHFLAFKVVAIIVIHVYSLPKYCLAAFPNLWGTKGWWWLAYTMVGVAIPIIIRLVYEKIRTLDLWQML